MTDDTPAIDLKVLTAGIVSAHVSSNSVHTTELPNFIRSIYDALQSLDAAPTIAPAPEKLSGAVTSRKSLSNPEHIISMINGKPYKILRQHLTCHGYTAESYRATFGLAKDYPMVAPNYVEHRRTLAHKIGLGRKPTAAAAKADAPIATSKTAKAPVRRGRKPKSAAGA